MSFAFIAFAYEFCNKQKKRRTCTGCLSLLTCTSNITTDGSLHGAAPHARNGPVQSAHIRRFTNRVLSYIMACNGDGERCKASTGSGRGPSPTPLLQRPC